MIYYRTNARQYGHDKETKNNVNKVSYIHMYVGTTFPSSISKNQSKCENKLTYYIDSSYVPRHGLYMKYDFFRLSQEKKSYRENGMALL